MYLSPIQRKLLAEKRTTPWVIRTNVPYGVTMWKLRLLCAKCGFHDGFPSRYHFIIMRVARCKRHVRVEFRFHDCHDMRDFVDCMGAILIAAGVGPK